MQGDAMKEVWALRIQKQKVKDEKNEVESKVYTVYNEVQQILNFTTIYPNIVKPQGEMMLDDYDMYAMGLYLAVVQPQDKVELMEEIQ